MTKATSVMAALDCALAAKIDAESELDLLWERLAEERGSLARADETARTAGLALARSGSDADRLASREALALKAEIERTISHLTDTLIPEAEEAKARTTEALADARRTVCADEAEAECAAVARQLAEEYPDLVQRLNDLKAAVAAADAKRVEANRGLPEGRAPIVPVEARVRNIPGHRGGEVSREVVSVWCYAGTCDPIPESRLGEITKTSRSRLVGGFDGHVLLSRSRTGNNHPVELRRLVRVTLVDRQEPARWARLSDLVLPPLRPAAPEPRRWVELRELTREDQAEGSALDGGEEGPE